jgi:hypothetical protein
MKTKFDLGNRVHWIDTLMNGQKVVQKSEIVQVVVNHTKGELPVENYRVFEEDSGSYVVLDVSEIFICKADANAALGITNR